MRRPWTISLPHVTQLRWQRKWHGHLCPLRYIEVLHLYRWYTHTHAPPQRGRWNENESEMTMKMKWKILSQDAKRGTQEKRERENTNTTHLARNGQTLKRQGKRKAEADGQRNKTSGGGGRQKRLNPPNTAKTYTNLSTQRAKPTWREENARTHEIKDPWGTS